MFVRIANTWGMPSASSLGFPPFSLVTASSEAAFSGCDQPDEAVFGAGTFSQFVPVGGNEIEKIALLLIGRGTGTVKIPARIHTCEPPVSYRSGPSTDRLLKESTLPWKGSGRHWVNWKVELTPLSGMKVGHYIRVELDLPEGIGWVRHRPYDPAFPGLPAKGRENPDAPPEPATFCFRVSPDQPCFWPVNVLPEMPGSNRFTGTWKSDPAAGLPQWIEISWKNPFLIDQLALSFPDSTECPTSYRVEFSAQNDETKAVPVDQNDSPSPAHNFDPSILGDRLRILFLSTRGSPSVSVRRVQVRRC